MKISNESIEAIRKAANIVDVVGEHTSLSNSGTHFAAVCPFDGCMHFGHRLFIVNPEAQVYKCFCCGAVGDSIKFTMDMRGISYEAALRRLAEQFEVEVIEDNLTTL